MSHPFDPGHEEFRQLLADIAETRIPFGMFGPAKYPPKGVPIMDLPVEYLVWFKERGFPKGRLGVLMEQVLEIKCAGLDSIFDPFRQAAGGRTPLRPVRKKRHDFD